MLLNFIYVYKKKNKRNEKSALMCSDKLHTNETLIVDTHFFSKTNNKKKIIIIIIILAHFIQKSD